MDPGAVAESLDGVVSVKAISLSLVSCHQQVVGIFGIQLDIDDACFVINEQNLLPLLSTVDGFEKPTLFVGTP